MSRRDRKEITKDGKIFTSIRVDIETWRRVNKYRMKPNESFSDALNKIINNIEKGEGSE